MFKYEVRSLVKEFVKETGQNEARYIVSFLEGYFGRLTHDHVNVVFDLIKEGVLTL